MGRHHPVAAIDFRVVERGPVDAGFQIVVTTRRGTPPKKRNMRTWASIPSASFCVQVASA
jgi:hypothetical protein